ncbi:hypothetical protein [Rhodovulum sulfidophilum]|nr:hypothetical protein [Rhodovulum sulfidophilum]
MPRHLTRIWAASAPQEASIPAKVAQLIDPETGKPATYLAWPPRCRRARA